MCCSSILNLFSLLFRSASSASFLFFSSSFSCLSPRWPHAQPPLGSIPHPEPRGREGSEGERRREGQMEGEREREREPQRVSLYSVRCYISVTSLRGRREISSPKCRSPAFCSPVINRPSFPILLFIVTSHS